MQQYLAWPGVVALIVIVALLIFRSPITRFIDRSHRFKLPGGASVDAEPQKQIEAQQEAAKPLPLPSAISSSGAGALPAPSATIAIFEGNIRNSLAAAFPDAPQTQLAWAIRTAALAQMERNHEQTYRVIFGSQIAALKELNIRGNMTVADARRIYDMARSAFPEVYASFSFDDWGGFILEHGLAKIVSPTGSDTDRVTMTPFGKDFLHFLVARSLSENKLF